MGKNKSSRFGRITVLNSTKNLKLEINGCTAENSNRRLLRFVKLRDGETMLIYVVSKWTNSGIGLAMREFEILQSVD